jgi:hypothetical protein
MLIINVFTVIDSHNVGQTFVLCGVIGSLFVLPYPVIGRGNITPPLIGLVTGGRAAVGEVPS